MKYAYVVVTYPPDNYQMDIAATICTRLISLKTAKQPNHPPPNCDDCFAEHYCYAAPQIPRKPIISENGIKWMKRFINQFYTKLPNEQLIIIDNSASPNLKEFIAQTTANVIQHINHPQYPHTHGSALDQAFTHLRSTGHTIATILEPDITITSTEWTRNLITPIIRDGMWMTAGQQTHGHIVPSAYNLDINWPSFDCQPQYIDANHPHYTEFSRWHATQRGWHKIIWDAGHKNRFYASSLHKLKLVDITGIEHHWNGRFKCPESI